MCKKILLYIGLFFSYGQLAGQDYQPLVIENNQWHYENKTWDIAPGGGWIFYYDYSTIAIKGDTLIDGTLYKKLYLLGGNNNDTFIGGIRENLETRKVYVQIVDTDLLENFVGDCTSIQNQEVLLYDFSVEVGDVISSCFPGGEVYQRDSVIHAGDTLDRIWVNGHVIIASEYWIEGIGSIRGLFGPFTGEFENEWSLLCFSSEIMTNFAGPNANPATAAACTDIVSLKPSQKLDIEYFPNPAREWLMIKGLDGANDELVLFNSLGQAVLHNNENASERQIDLSALHSGVYQIAIYQNQQMVWMDQLVIIR